MCQSPTYPACDAGKSVRFWVQEREDFGGLRLEVQFCLSPIRTKQDERGRGAHLMLPMAVAMLSALTRRFGRQGTAVLGEFGAHGLCVPQVEAGAWLHDMK